MKNASEQISEFINKQEDWQKSNLELFRKLVHKVEPAVQEDWKWSVPVFLINGKLVCAMSTFKNHTKYNFFEGASLKDEQKLFNSGLDSKKHRSINIELGHKIDEAKLQKLISEAFESSK